MEWDPTWHNVCKDFSQSNVRIPPEERKGDSKIFEVKLRARPIEFRFGFDQSPLFHKLKCTICLDSLRLRLMD